MRRWLLLALAALCLLSLPARAGEQVVAGLSQARVAITTDFAGSEILVFGAVKRNAPYPEEPPLQVIVTVAGPLEPVTVRRKSRSFGIWVNTASIEVDAAPGFYAIAATAPLTDALTFTEDLRYKVSVPQMIRAVGAPVDIPDAEAFVSALIRIRDRNGHYVVKEGAVSLTEDTLFRTSIALPANLAEGDYTTRIFLTRGGRVIDIYQTKINVTMVGLERWAFNLAHEQPLIYGLLSLMIAAGAGWAASAAFRYIRG
jgi:uncharacterized protein (TIGR02186 family)